MDIEIGVGDTRPPNVLEHTLSLPLASSNGVEVAALFGRLTVHRTHDWMHGHLFPKVLQVIDAQVHEIMQRIDEKKYTQELDQVHTCVFIQALAPAVVCIRTMASVLFVEEHGLPRSKRTEI